MERGGGGGGTTESGQFRGNSTKTQQEMGQWGCGGGGGGGGRFTALFKKGKGEERQERGGGNGVGRRGGGGGGGGGRGTVPVKKQTSRSRRKRTTTTTTNFLIQPHHYYTPGWQKHGGNHTWVVRVENQFAAHRVWCPRHQNRGMYHEQFGYSLNRITVWSPGLPWMERPLRSSWTLSVWRMSCSRWVRLGLSRQSSDGRTCMHSGAWAYWYYAV